LEIKILKTKIFFRPNQYDRVIKRVAYLGTRIPPCGTLAEVLRAKGF
jgi:hypothetical protein